MNSKNDVKSISRFDAIKWLLIVAFLLAAIILNYFYSNLAWGIRAAMGIVIGAIVLAVGYQTQKGRRAWGFIKEARIELRRVSWPSRRETVQTTFIVIAAIILVSLLLWGLDSFFFWVMAWLTGQRG